MGWIQDPGSEIQKQTYPGSRIPGSKKHQIPGQFFSIDSKTKSKNFNWKAENAILKKEILKPVGKSNQVSVTQTAPIGSYNENIR